jgi:hypothetical protein
MGQDKGIMVSGLQTKNGSEALNEDDEVCFLSCDHCSYPKTSPKHLVLRNRCEGQGQGLRVRSGQDVRIMVSGEHTLLVSQGKGVIGWFHV